jgi:TatD DNase family protein
MLIDTHAHIYLDDFEGSDADILARAEKEGVRHIFMPNIDSSSVENMLRTESRYPNCHAMMGLHPCSVKENYEKELSNVESWFVKRSFAAVGEIGIDLYWDKSFAEAQMKAFERQIALGRELGIPIVIHSREALDITIQTVGKWQDGNLKGVFHCFTGTLEQALQISDLGFYIGIGGVVTYKNAGLDKVIAGSGLDFAVLETDSPYLAPVPHRGKTNEPSYLRYIADKLSEITGRSVTEVEDITSRNAMRLFSGWFAVN